MLFSKALEHIGEYPAEDHPEFIEAENKWVAARAELQREEDQVNEFLRKLANCPQDQAVWKKLRMALDRRLQAEMQIGEVEAAFEVWIRHWDNVKLAVVYELQDDRFQEIVGDGELHSVHKRWMPISWFTTEEAAYAFLEGAGCEFEVELRGVSVAEGTRRGRSDMDLDHTGREFRLELERARVLCVGNLRSKGC